MHRTQRMESCKAAVKKHPLSILLIIQLYIYMHNMYIIKGSLDEKLPIYEQDPKSKRLDSFEKRFVRD